MDPRSMHNLIIPGWMIFELGLNYSELRVYALIYGFSQGGQGDFHGNLDYLASWCGISNRSNVRRVLRSLHDKHLITRHSERVLHTNGHLYTRIHYMAQVPELYKLAAEQSDKSGCHNDHTPLS